MSRSKRLAVEFDGTICDMMWPQIGTIKAGARETLKKFQYDNWIIIIHSTRNNITFDNNENQELLHKMKEFLDKHDIPYNFIDDGKNGKVIADKYLGHRNIKFTNWRDAHTEVLYGRKATRNDNLSEKPTHNPDSYIDGMGEI